MASFFYFVDYCWSVGRSSKILLKRHVCCLWIWGVSSGLRQKQQNPASEACLLPLDLGSFFGSSSEATKSCFRGVFAAFGFWEFLRVFVRSNKILLPRHVCCLWTWGVSSGLRQRQQNPATEARLLPLDLVSFFGSVAEAAEIQHQGRISCLWLK